MYIEIDAAARRYLDLPDEKKAAAAKKKKHKRKKHNYATGFGIKAADLVIELNTDFAVENKTLIEEKLYTAPKINEKSSVEITLNDGRELNNWNYETNEKL
ncbi:hypothetical protein E0M27_17350 [Bacillus mycoides]|uniref:hypothetical protein n=1 Tax=Bacillus mycoides TaxID=1405 RepID=UPI00103DDB18|nr:hypothetical protein [Bacillus mycoides]TBX55035.1 hypothetical protein E0M27_17350 [Bacillus mycoides]